jgi:serine/threonine-protein kinase
VELVRAARVPSITQQNPEVEPELEAVVRKALARDVSQRFQTAGELQDAIAQYLFSRGMKVTSRDVANLVQSCLAEKQKSQPRVVRPKSLIDELIQEEMLKFTSLDATAAVGGAGGEPLSPEDLEAAKPLDPGAFVDTRGWTEEVGDEATMVDDGGPFGANGVPAGRSATPAPEDRIVTPVGRATSGKFPSLKQSGSVPALADKPGPAPRATSGRLRTLDSAESLERMLEGGRTPGASAAVAPAKAAKSGRGIWIALVALLLAVGGGVLILVKAGVIGHQ